MKIIAIETSCDETAASVVESKGKTVDGPRFKILSNVVSSQVKIHAPWGGVVPMLAKREHQKNLIPVLKKALAESRLLKKIPNSKFQIPNKSEFPNSKLQTPNKILEREDILLKKLIPFLKAYRTPKIDAVAVTYGPGLAPALWPGVNLARALSYYWRMPLIGINHLEGHIIANWLEPIGENPQFAMRNSQIFPIVCLIVSGGHTQLILMKDFGRYQLIGETRDDAAGECFDKVAKILGLGYPGGPIISKLAANWKSRNSNPRSRHNSQFVIRNAQLDIKLPRPMIKSADYDFSFSGLKTAVLYLVKDIKKNRRLSNAVKAEIAADCQQSIIDVLVIKTLRAAKELCAKTVILSGGVAANDELRHQLASAAKKMTPETKFLVPPKKFCTDNAAMIAAAALSRRSKKGTADWRRLTAEPNLRLA